MDILFLLTPGFEDSARDGLTTKDVMAIYRDRAGDLWVGGTGVFRFNGTSFDRMY